MNIHHKPDRELSYVEQYLAPLREYLTDDNINELSINPDGSIFVEAAGAVHMHRIDVTLSPHAIKRLGAQLAGETRNTLGALHPIVSGRVMVWGNPQRVQVVIEPAIELGVSLSIRKYLTRTLDTKEIGFVEGAQIKVIRQLSIWRTPVICKVCFAVRLMRSSIFSFLVAHHPVKLR
jgi:type IV secretion system protein VirB11